MSKVFLRSLLFVGLCTFTLGLAQPAKAIVILSNLPGTSIGGGTLLGLGLDGLDRTKAVGLTVGANDLSFTSLTGLFRNPDNASRAVTGGIFSDVGGNPGAQLVAFNPTSVAAGAVNALETLTAVSAFTLMANTSYWFVLDGPNFGNSLEWDVLSSSVAPTPSAEVSFDGYRFSSTGGVSWVGSNYFNGVQIEASRIVDLPEPGILAIFGLGLIGLGVACRRARA